MEHSPSEANSHSESQEISRLVRNPKVHCHVHINPCIEQDESSPQRSTLFL